MISSKKGVYWPTCDNDELTDEVTLSTYHLDRSPTLHTLPKVVKGHPSGTGTTKLVTPRVPLNHILHARCTRQTVQVEGIPQQDPALATALFQQSV